MKNLYLFIIISLFSLLSFSQTPLNCDGSACLANPVIFPQNIVICNLDSSLLPPDTLADGSGVLIDENDCYEVCEYSTAVYTTAFNPGSIYTWNISGHQSYTTNSNGNEITVLWGPASSSYNGSGEISVQEVDINGCVGNYSICINILETPMSQMTWNPSITTFCKNSNIQFYATNMNTSTNISTISSDYYYWDFGDGSFSTDQNPIHSFSSSGSYDVMLVISNECNCVDTVITTFQITSDEGPNLTTCISTMCEDDTAQYCTDAISPLWSVEGGTIFNSVNTDPCIYVVWDNATPTIDNGYGTLLITDLSSNCSPAQSIFQIPVIPLNPIIEGKSEGCSSDILSYSFFCIPGAQYSWEITDDNGDPVSSNYAYITKGQKTCEIHVQFGWPLGSYQIKLTVSTENLDCFSNEASKTVNILDKIYFNYISDVCENDLSTISVSNNTLGEDLEWQVTGGTIQNLSGPPYISTQIDVLWDQGPGTYHITASPVNSGIWCQELAAETITVFETPPVPTSIEGEINICPNETYLYSAEPPNSLNHLNATYHWDIIGGVIDGSTSTSATGESILVQWNGVGPYQLEVVNVSENGFTTSCVSDPLLVNLNLPAPYTPLITGPSTACVNGESIYFLNNFVAHPFEIEWEVTGGSVVDGQGTPQITIEWGDLSGSYDVQINVTVCNQVYSSVVNVFLDEAQTSFTISPNPICPGETVSFTPTSGSGNYSWDFGDGIGTSTVQNPTYLYPATTPAGTYTVNLEYEDNTNGCTANFGTDIEVFSAPKGILSPNFPLIYFCSGDPINQDLIVTLNDGNQSSSIVWYHTPPGGIQQIAQNQGFPNTGVYNVIATAPDYLVPFPGSGNALGEYEAQIIDQITGCTGTIGPITIDTTDCSYSCPGGTCPGPPLPISYLVYCGTNGVFNVDFTAPTTGGPITWHFADGTPSVTSWLSSITHTYAQAGLYDVYCTDANGVIIAWEKIEIPFIVDWNFGIFCDQNNANQITVNFQDNSTYLLSLPSSQFSLLWDFGDGNTSSNHNPSHIYSSTGLHTVSLTVTYGTPPIYSCTKTTVINVPLLEAPFSYQGTLCVQEPIQFDGPSVDIVDWLWDFDDGDFSGNEDPKKTYTAAGTYQVSLTVTDINGCQATRTESIVINDLPVFTLSTPIGPFCVNDPIFDLSTQIVVQPTAAVINWYGTGIINQGGVFYFDPYVAGEGTHEICVEVTENCEATECIDIIVICPDKPQVFGYQDACKGTFLQFFTQEGYTSYKWYIDGIHQTVYTDYYMNYQPQVAGIYDITVEFTDDNGCSAMSDIFSLTIHDSPQNFSVNPNTTICPDQLITLTHSGIETGVNYFWNTTPVYTSPSITIMPNVPYFEVTALNEFGCETKSNQVNVAPEIKLCSILSGCYCDTTLMDSDGEVFIAGVIHNFASSEWLVNGGSFSPPQTGIDLQFNLADPAYSSLMPMFIVFSGTDNYGCSYFSDTLFIEKCDTDTCTVNLLNISSGYDHINDVPFIGPFSNPSTQNEQIWYLVDAPINPPAIAQPAFILPPNAAWGVQNGSNWISPYQTSVWQINNEAPAAPYSFRHCFCTGDSAEIDIHIEYLSDDQTSIYFEENGILNMGPNQGGGVLIGSQPILPATQGTNFLSPPDILDYSAWVGAGTHCIRAELRNLHGVAMGLDINGYIEGAYMEEHYCCAQGSIIGKKYADLNCNGEYDAAIDSVMSGWTMYLYDDNGVLIGTAITDIYGIYVFNSLAPGDYFVEEEMQPGWYQSAPGGGSGCGSPGGYDITIDTTLSIATDIDFGNCIKECVELISDTVVCIEDDLYLLEMELQNTSNFDFSQYTISPMDPNVLISPSYYNTIWFSGDYQSFSVDISNVPDGQDSLCMFFSAYDILDEECCFDTICIDLPDWCNACDTLLDSAGEWDPSITYSNGDYVSYNNHAWIFWNTGLPDNTPNPPGEPNENCCVGWFLCDEDCSLPWLLSGANIWNINNLYNHGDLVLMGGNTGELYDFYSTTSPGNTTSVDVLDDPHWNLCLTNQAVGIEDLNQEEFLIYPNPFTNQTTIAYNFNEKTELIVEVNDVLGNKIAELHNGMVQKGSNKIVWKANDVPSGVYFVKFIINNNARISKLVMINK